MLGSSNSCLPLLPRHSLPSIFPTITCFTRQFLRNTLTNPVSLPSCIICKISLSSLTLCNLLLQSALQPLWVLACSTIVEYSQQEGFYREPLPAARKTPSLEDQWLERSNTRHQVSPTSEMTRANRSNERWNYGWEMAGNFAEIGYFHFTFGFFYVP